MKYTFSRYRNSQVADMLDNMGLDHCVNESDSDILVVPGGGDVHPAFYGDEKSTFTKTATTDQSEFSKIRDFALSGRKIIGICRGAQLLCVAAGGALIQDIKGHKEDHNIKFADGNYLRVNSRHHQMMYPFSLDRSDYSMIAWSEGLSKIRKKKDELSYVVGSTMANKDVTIPSSQMFFTGRSKKKDNPQAMEPEVVIFHNINGIAIQYHPEDMHSHRDYRKGLNYTLTIIKSFLTNEI